MSAVLLPPDRCAPSTEVRSAVDIGCHRKVPDGVRNVDAMLDKPTAAVDDAGDVERDGRRRRELRTGRPRWHPRFRAHRPPSKHAGPPALRTGVCTSVHAVHTMMMVMTSIEESGKIHIPNDAASRVPGTPVLTLLSTERSWTAPAHGVDLT
jgi:hypothetical protein